MCGRGFLEKGTLEGGEDVGLLRGSWKSQEGPFFKGIDMGDPLVSFIGGAFHANIIFYFIVYTKFRNVRIKINVSLGSCFHIYIVEGK